MIENEFKIMLNLEQYEKLLAMYEWNEVITQINHYYDTDDLLMSSLHITVRVREIDGKYFLQEKLPGEAQYSRVELEKPLEFLPDVIGVGDLPDSPSLDVTGIKRLGQLKTVRNVHRFEGGEIDLDKSEYFDKTDYEIEIEFLDENNARKVLEEIKKKLDIKPNSEVCAGKIRRFLEEYKNAAGSNN